MNETYLQRAKQSSNSLTPTKCLSNTYRTSAFSWLTVSAAGFFFCAQVLLFFWLSHMYSFHFIISTLELSGGWLSAPQFFFLCTNISFFWHSHMYSFHFIIWTLEHSGVQKKRESLSLFGSLSLSLSLSLSFRLLSECSSVEIIREKEREMDGKRERHLSANSQRRRFFFYLLSYVLHFNHIFLRLHHSSSCQSAQQCSFGLHAFAVFGLFCPGTCRSFAFVCESARDCHSLIYIYIYIHTCIYIYIYVCMYAYVYIYIYVCVYIYIYIYVCMYAYVYIYIYVRVCVGKRWLSVSLHFGIRVWIGKWLSLSYTYIHIYMHVCMYIYIHMCIYIFVCVCVGERWLWVSLHVGIRVWIGKWLSLSSMHIYRHTYTHI